MSSSTQTAYSLQIEQSIQDTISYITKTKNMTLKKNKKKKKKKQTTEQFKREHALDKVVNNLLQMKEGERKARKGKGQAESQRKRTRAGT